MPITVSVSEAKNRLSALLKWATENQEAVVVESRGQPQAAFLSYEHYKEYLSLRETARRRAAMERLKELAEEMRARNDDLTAEEAGELVDEISQETISQLASKGRVTFEEA
jgi:prevent-host-death family protein